MFLLDSIVDFKDVIWLDKSIILFLSNVEFKTVPYVHFESLKQFVDLSNIIEDYDNEHDTLTVTYASSHTAYVTVNVSCSLS